MKRIFTAVTAVTLIVIGCAMPGCSTVSEEAYSKQELNELSDYLLGKNVEPSTDPDLNRDGRVDAFDLCIMRDRTYETDGAGVLVTYFSCTNNTAGVAQFIAASLGADTYQITPEVPYTEDDLKYYTDCRADREQKDPDARPAITGTPDNLDDYDVIFLGYPIWHGQAPKVMYTFLESCDISGKTVIPFCTSGSSPIGSSGENLKKCAPDANWLEGRRFSGGAPESEVREWVESLNIGTKKEADIMYITVGETRLTAELADNSSARALAELLAEGPLTIDMSDYGNFEKVGELGTTLPRNDEQITTVPGDLILYLGSRFVIYYDTNSWNFTRLGRVKDVTQDELKALLGKGDVTVTLSLT